ncbi:MAG TPA: hypothetical protein VE172_08285 [Stackebrandtia sp.]|jgi:hypothetical protein|uniref:hypothetical protein n=1 Tax=Stackebrandtia sp. TaxID=2023065 RepID=UPI002D482003|nr:hypothetical protein [Stackebrandtia sp.]HZE38797.1 hypothetical protein [Stackebrandtia sp.]
MIGALHSEWTKLRSVRSTMYVLLAIAAVLALLMVFEFYAVGIYDDASAAHRETFQMARADDVLFTVLQLCAAIVGTLAVTSEQSTGMLRTTFASVPRRAVVLGAKAIVVSASSVVGGLAFMYVAFFGSLAVVGDRHIRDFAGPLSDEIPRMLLYAVPLLAFALIGLGLGAALRSTAGGITAVVLVTLIVPRILVMVPSPWNARIGAFLPEDLLLRLQGHPQMSVDLKHADPGFTLSPTGAGLILAAYGILAVLIGTTLVSRRDA